MTPSKLQIIHANHSCNQIIHAIKSGRLSEDAIIDITVVLNELLDRYADSKDRFAQEDDETQTRR